MNDDREKLIDKIRKLLARADEARNDNAHEREIAMRHANALLARHNLALEDVETEIDARDELGKLGRSFEDLGSPAAWRSGIWATIANLNDCFCVSAYDERGRKRKIAIIGRQLRIEVTRSIASYLVASVERESKAYGRSSAAFAVGAWHGIHSQCARILAQQAKGVIDGEQLSESKAIAIVNQREKALTEVREAVSEFYPKLGKAAPYKIRGDREAMGSGYAYGKSLSVNNQIGGKAKPAIGRD